MTFTVDEYEDDFGYITHPHKRIALEIPEMLEELTRWRQAAGLATDEFPVVLSVGERRSYTANDIFRDPGWRKRDPDGALRVSAEDARARPRPTAAGPRHDRPRQCRGDRGGERARC